MTLKRALHAIEGVCVKGLGDDEPGILYVGRPGGVSGYPRAWYRSVS